MPINNSYNEAAIVEAIATALDNFYTNLIKKVDSLNVKTVMKRKNPYLFRAKAMNGAAQIIDAILAAFVSSSEETIFGNVFFEPIATAAAQGQKALAEGVDIMVERDNTIYAIAVKSGTSVFNADSRKKQEQNFMAASKLAQQAKKRFVPIVGYGYGKKKVSNRGLPKFYMELAGKDFWTELTGDEELKKRAIEYTNILNPIRELKGTHDVGFMMNCSYGNALRLAPNDTIKAVLVETADNLCARFNPEIGCIRSWDFGAWNFPVIIDNMMNLDLLFNVYKLTGDEKYKNVAVKHAQTTMKNHFRPDYTSYHVVSYNNDGSVEIKQTHQGKNAESAWSRGQAWGVYGYTSCYRETRDTAFLQEAVHIADMIMERVKTDDLIPYWDYDAPAGEKTPRDASAAAVTASAFLELSTFAPDGKKYSDYAETILKNLSGPKYLAAKGSNQGYVLMHSTGSLPHGSEIDVPLNYADYYYMEALKRYIDLKNKG